MNDSTPRAAPPAAPPAKARASARLPLDDDRTRALREKTQQTAKLNLLDRERSLIQFNRRVLAQARRPEVPLLERLRYVTIVSSNLDEFFEVRVADYIEAVRQPGSGITQADLEAVARAAHELIDEQYAVFNDEVMPALAAFHSESGVTR